VAEAIFNSGWRGSGFRKTWSLAWRNLDHKTIEEANPHFGERNAVAEAVLSLFYEMENTRILTREYTSGDSISGQVMYVSVFNTWMKALSIPDNYVYVNHNDDDDKLRVVSLSETSKDLLESCNR